MRQRVHDLGLDSWFQPSVSVQRRGADMGGVTAPVIERGDVLHCDFGLVALGLATDTQHMAYVLREGETDAPAGLQQALANSNRFQDILLEETKVGRTGNEILASVLEKMRAEGLNGTMYTHPIGEHGHGAGPLIGLWDYQTGVPGRGDPPRNPGHVVLDRTPGDDAGARMGTASRCAWHRRRKRRSRWTARSAGCSGGRPNST